LPEAITASSWPALRLTVRIGWTISSTPMSRRRNSAETESTRNGMSSLTISITVWSDFQPWSSSVGL